MSTATFWPHWNPVDALLSYMVFCWAKERAGFIVSSESLSDMLKKMSCRG